MHHLVRRKREKEREMESLNLPGSNEYNAGRKNGGGGGDGDGGGETAGKVIKCKAAVVWGPGEPFQVEEVEVEPPRRMEVRLRILFTSICHSDLGAWKGENESQRVFPRIFGHEAAGVVESVGDGVEDLKPDDRVIPVFNGECGDCAACRSPKTNKCAGFAIDLFRSVMPGDGGVRFYSVGPNGERRPVYHFMNASTFAEYTVVHYANVLKLPIDAPLNRMCLLSCGVSTGVGAAWNTANVEKEAKVAVFGLGAIGLAVVEGARLRGAAQIIGVDINPNKIVKGREMGITDFINPKDYTKPVNEVIRELTNGGVDYSFECAGNMNVLREAFLSTHEDFCIPDQAEKRLRFLGQATPLLASSSPAIVATRLHATRPLLRQPSSSPSHLLAGDESRYSFVRHPRRLRIFSQASRRGISFARNPRRRRLRISFSLTYSFRVLVILSSMPWVRLLAVSLVHKTSFLL